MTKLKSILTIVIFIYLLVGLGHAFWRIVAERIACASDSWLGFFWCPNSSFSFAFKYAFDVLFWPSHYL